MTYLGYIRGNLRRKPIGTIFTFLSIVFGFIMFGLVLGLVAKFRQISESANPERIYTSPRFGGRLAIAQMQQMSRMPYISHVGALGAIVGHYQTPRNRVVVLMQGPGMREVFRELPLTSQQWAMLARTRDGVFVSRLYSIRYALRTGSQFSVISADAPRADGSSLWTFTVLAVVPDIPLMPIGFAVGNYDYLDQSRPEADRSAVQQLWVLAQDPAHTSDVTREIDQWFSNSSLPTKSVSETQMLAASGGGGGDAIIALICLALAGMVMVAFLTGNALRHSIRERTTEIAVLKTLGFSNVVIAALVVAEVLLPCLFGCLFGLAIAAGLAALTPVLLPAAITIPVPRIDFEVISAGIAAALLIACVAGAVPVFRIARLDVATALARQ